MIYDGVINKPSLDELYHFNKNHDPKSGQFTSGSGGVIITSKGFTPIKLGSMTIEGILPGGCRVDDSDIISALCYVLSESLIVCASSAVIAKLSELYFTRELKDGTPFTLEGARQIQRLGIITVSISFGSQILYAIIKAIFERIYKGSTSDSIYLPNYILLGLFFILLAQIFRYGAELKEKADKLPDNEALQELTAEETDTDLQ